MTAIDHLRNWSTLQYVKVAGVLMLAAWAMDAVTGPLWVRFGIHGHLLESLSTGIFYTAYSLMCLLLPVAAFRPENRFSLKGDCKLRAKRFALVAGIHAIIFACILIALL